MPLSTKKHMTLALAIASTAALPGSGVLASRACAGPESTAAASETSPRVVSTFYPLHVAALNVMRGLGEPSLLLEPAGGCAHGLSLRPSQVRDLGLADIVLETGLGLEPFLDTGRLPLPAGLLRIPAAQLIPADDLIELSDDHDHGSHAQVDHDGHGPAAHDDHAHDPHDHAAHGHDDHAHDAHFPASDLPAWDSRDGFNGHAWSSPRLAGKMAQAIGEGLAETDRPRATRYRAQADAYADELYRLADELHAATTPLRGQRVVLSHTSLAYLARDCGLTVVATLHDEDEAEPTSRGLARLIDAVRDGGADAILVDPQDRGRLAPLVAAETGVTRELTLDPAAAGPLEPGAYLATMRRKLETLRAWAAEVAKESPADAGSPGDSAGDAAP